MEQQIINVCRQCYFQLRQLRVIRRSLSPGSLKTLLHAFIASRLDYCNSLYYGLPMRSIGRLQSVQNAAVRLFGGIARYDHVTPVMRDTLHWLPIEQRIQFKIASLTYKSIHELAPRYLSDLLSPVSDQHFLTRNRSAVRGDLVPHRFRTSFYGQRGFHFAAPKIWNRLPIDIRQSDTFTLFARKLKTFLFTEAYFPVNA